MIGLWPRATPPSRLGPNILKTMFYSLYATFPWDKCMYIWVSQYPNRVYVSKHLKKLNFLNYGQSSWVLPIDYLLVPVAQLFPNCFPTNKLIGRSINRLIWEGLKERRRYRIIILRLSLTAFDESLFLMHFPKLQETLVSLIIDILPFAWDIMVLVMEEDCWRLG